MNAELYFALCGAALVALSLFVLVAIPHLLRKLLAFNVLASGIFLMLVGLGQRGGEPDPIPQALVLTGIVVSFAATALALTLMRRWFRMSGRFTLDSGTDGPARPAADATGDPDPTVPERTDRQQQDVVAENIGDPSSGVIAEPWQHDTGPNGTGLSGTPSSAGVQPAVPISRHTFEDGETTRAQQAVPLRNCMDSITALPFDAGPSAQEHRR